MKDVEKIKPTGLFTNYIFKAIPLAFDESMSYYETLCSLLSYLKETVIPTVNNNADAIIEVQNLMTQLQNYVDNYFNNLNVQNEINNKLDEMAEDGTLYNIIKSYTDPIVNEQNSRITQVENKVQAVASGSPLVASSVSEMTDTSRVYVNTTDGKWYYYDGDSWEIGGTYQATGDSENLDYIITSSKFGTITNGKYVKYNNGNLDTLENLKASDFINITPYSKIYVSNLNMTHNIDARGMAFYDKNKNFISGYQYQTNSPDFNIIAPSNAYFMRLTIGSNNNPTLKIVNKFDEIVNNLNLLSTFNYDITEYAKQNLIPDTYMNSNDGNVRPLAHTYTTQFIPCVENIKIIIDDINVRNDPRGIAFYDENFTFISGKDYRNVVNKKLEVISPNNTKYAVFTIDNNSNFNLKYVLSYNQLNELQIKLNKNYYLSKTLYQGKEMQVFNKILCIGDSLTAGVFNHNEGGETEYVKIEQYSYPTKLHEKLNVDVTNISQGGLTTQQIYNYLQNMDLSGHDCCIICVGQNDTDASQVSSALQSIINKVKSENKNIKIFITSIIKCYYIRNEGRYYSINSNIRSIANNTENCYYIPLVTDSFCADETPYVQGHLTALGYDKECDELIGYISYIIANNLNDFKYVQFIGTDYEYIED